jgi:hypothetical protein
VTAYFGLKTSRKIINTNNSGDDNCQNNRANFVLKINTKLIILVILNFNAGVPAVTKGK